MNVKDRHGNEYEYGYEVDQDEEGALVVILFSDDSWAPTILDTLGGVVCDFDVSDHGNINVSPETEEYLRQTAEDMANDLDVTEQVEA